MNFRSAPGQRPLLFFAGLLVVGLSACGHSSPSANGEQGTAAPQAAAVPAAPPAETTGGFDGTRAYKHVEQLVAIGPHSAGSAGIRRAQDYIIGQLKSFGCPVDKRIFMRRPRRWAM